MSKQNLWYCFLCQSRGGICCVCEELYLGDLQRLYCTSLPAVDMYTFDAGLKSMLFSYISQRLHRKWGEDRIICVSDLLALAVLNHGHNQCIIHVNVFKCLQEWQLKRFDWLISYLPSLHISVFAYLCLSGRSLQTQHSQAPHTELRCVFFPKRPGLLKPSSVVKV